MKSIKLGFAILSGLIFATACATAQQNASPAPSAAKPDGEQVPAKTSLEIQDPTHILFVGNSYLYYGDSVHNHVRRMVEASGLFELSDLTYKSATVGGAAIFDHNLDHYLEPQNLRVDRPFEVVLLQGGSAAPLTHERRARFAETVAEFSDKIEISGGETVLYMTHAYVPPHRRYRRGMIEDIASLYVAVGNENDALVIPVGLAFEEAYRRNPDIVLHKSFDGSHPSLHGTYLAAATVYASLYGTSPVGNTYDYFGAIDPDTAMFLQTVAWETVSSFYIKNKIKDTP